MAIVFATIYSVTSRHPVCTGSWPKNGDAHPTFVPRCIGVVSRNRRGRPRVLHLRRSSASWMNAQSLLRTGHCDEKNCMDRVNKNRYSIIRSGLPTTTFVALANLRYINALNNSNNNNDIFSHPPQHLDVSRCLLWTDTASSNLSEAWCVSWEAGSRLQWSTSHWRLTIQSNNLVSTFPSYVVCAELLPHWQQLLCSKSTQAGTGVLWQVRTCDGPDNVWHNKRVSSIASFVMVACTDCTLSTILQLTDWKERAWKHSRMRDATLAMALCLSVTSRYCFEMAGRIELFLTRTLPSTYPTLCCKVTGISGATSQTL